MAELEDSAVCPDTGFALVRASGEEVTRITETIWGPLDPLLRHDPATRDDWCRWDVLDGRTIDGGIPPECSYAEVLSDFKRRSQKTKISDLFKDEPSDSTIEDEVEKEWRERGHMPPYTVPAIWRLKRNIYDLALPDDGGWFVDIEAPESISAIERHHRDLLDDFGIKVLTKSHLHSEDRRLTTRLAERLKTTVLWDGSLPHGIFFTSKHGSKRDRPWHCWAVWLRKVDDGHPIDLEPTKWTGSNHIPPPHSNPPLQYVLDLFGLKGH